VFLSIFFTLKLNLNKNTNEDFCGKIKIENVGEHYLKNQRTGNYLKKGGTNSPEVFREYIDFDNTPSNHT
jgi:hypothetical protein